MVPDDIEWVILLEICCSNTEGLMVTEQTSFTVDLVLYRFNSNTHIIESVSHIERAK